MSLHETTQLLCTEVHRSDFGSITRHRLRSVCTHIFRPFCASIRSCTGFSSSARDPSSIQVIEAKVGPHSSTSAASSGQTSAIVPESLRHILGQGVSFGPHLRNLSATRPRPLSSSSLSLTASKTPPFIPPVVGPFNFVREVY